MARAALSVRVRASIAKNRKSAVLPLARDAAALLHAGRRSIDARAPVFPRIPLVPTLKRDLKAAGIAFENDEGIVVFHSFRHTLSTQLSRVATPAQHAEMMRHQDPSLSLKVYTRLRVDDLRDTVDRLAGPEGDSASARSG